MKNQSNTSPIARVQRQWAKEVAGHCAQRLCCLWPPLCSGLARLRQVVFRFDPESLELQTGVLALSVGGWLAWASLRSGQSETLLGRLGAHLWPTPLWAAAFTLVGAAQISALGRARVRVRCRCAMSGFCLWMFLFILAVLDAVPGLGVALFPFIALSEAWVYLRLSVPPRRSRGWHIPDERGKAALEEVSASTIHADIHS